jgi:hypothetical protein
VLEKEPDRDALTRSTPALVRHLIARCLEKDRRQRLRDIGDALPELADEPAVAGASRTTGETPASSRFWRPLAIAPRRSRTGHDGLSRGVQHFAAHDTTRLESTGHAFDRVSGIRTSSNALS